MDLCGKNSNIGDLMSQSEITLLAEEFIKKEPPQVDCRSSLEVGTNHHMTEEQPNGAVGFYSNEDSFNTEQRPEVTGLNAERTDLFDKDVNCPEENPHIPDVPSNESELQSNKYTSSFFNTNEDYEMKLGLNQHMESKEQLAELLHEEIEIKTECEGEWENNDGIYSVNAYETASIPPRSGKHMKHLGEKPFVCLQCDYKCNRKSALKQHQTIHSVEARFACNQCDYKANFLANLKKHQMKHLGKKPFACDQCDYTTLYSHDLKKHQMRHSGEKPFACDQCSYKGATFRHLKDHKMKHSGQKPFACGQCDYTTLYSYAVKRHQLLHSDEKPFACSHCNYKSNDLGNLKKHQKQHSGKKPFSCDQCGYKGATSRHLKGHKMTHSGEKTFACDQCDYKSNNFRNLKRHYMKHPQEK